MKKTEFSWLLIQCVRMVSFDCIAGKPSYTSKAYTGYILHNALQISVSDAENWQSLQGLYTYLSCKLEFLPVNTITYVPSGHNLILNQKTLKWNMQCMFQIWINQCVNSTNTEENYLERTLEGRYTFQVSFAYMFHNWCAHKERTGSHYDVSVFPSLTEHFIH